MHQGNLYKASTDNILFFNRNRILTIYKRAKLNNDIYLYCVEEDSEKIDGRFFREELFALNIIFKMRPVLIYFRAAHLNEENKFTLDFSDQEFVQKIDFLLKNTYYIATINCKLKEEIMFMKPQKLKTYLQKVDFYLKKVLQLYAILTI